MTNEIASTQAAQDGTPSPGTVLGGKYLVESVLGQGGMGVVLRGRHLRTEQAVAIKLLRKEAREIPDVTARFEREARAAAKIQGPHVVRVYDVDTLPDGAPMMVMELLQGWELGQELASRGPLPPTEAVDHILAACDALAQAHRMGIIHRDIKPANLFLSQEGNRRVLKVLDFGISKVLDKRDNAAHTATTAAFGTPQYMSPEQVRSTKNVDGRADIWSLGVVLYELLGGRAPFDHPSATAILASIIADTPKHLREIRKDIPPKLADVVMKALEKRVENRFPDIESFMFALLPFGSKEAAASASLIAKPAPKDEATKRLAIQAALIATVIVGVFLLLLVLVKKSKQTDPAPLAEPQAPATTTMPAAAPSTMPDPIPTPTPTPTPAAASASAPASTQQGAPTTKATSKASAPAAIPTPVATTKKAATPVEDPNHL